MKHEHNPNDLFKRELTLMTEVETQSDRGCAIIATSWLEEELKAALKSVLSGNERAWKKLFSSTAPLANFSSKIELAALIGIIDESTYFDLHAIRKIRNEFAHEITTADHEALSFDAPHIRDRCYSLRAIANESCNTPRKAFVRSCGIINANLYLFWFAKPEPISALLSKG